MDWMRKELSPERQLAHTVAVEHFTALMAEEFLLKYDALDENGSAHGTDLGLACHRGIRAQGRGV